VMKVPIMWLMSDLSDGQTGKRYVAKEWDAKLPPGEAAEKAVEEPVYRTAPWDRN
jgi:hypothetical protein